MPEPWRSTFASSEAVHERMSRQKRRDTTPEVALRRALHKTGMRYFVHRRPLAHLRREADLVFPRRRVAVFVDGCFWHLCPEHGVRPGTNSNYWTEKLDRNARRDRETDELLKAAGWSVVRVWEHEDADSAAARVVTAVRLDAA